MCRFPENCIPPHFCSARFQQFEGLLRRKQHADVKSEVKAEVKVEVKCEESNAAAAVAPMGVPAEDDAVAPAAPIILPARRRRVIDVLQEQLADSEGDSDGSGDEEEDLVLDWRAKGV